MSVCVSVIVIAFSQREPLRESLRSISSAAASVSGEVELIVVDNGGLAEQVGDWAPEARIIVSEHNLGFAGGVCRGITVASGEWIMLVNDDATLTDDSLAHLLGAGESDPRIGAVAAQIRFASSPEVINSAGIEVDSLGVASERLAGAPAASAAEPAEVFGASGCVALYRRQALDQVGGFDERFFAYQEDVDLAWRLRSAGWIAVYEPAAIAHHLGSASSGEGSARKYFLVGRNRVRLLARNATTRQLMRYWPAILLYDAAYVTYTALSDRNLGALRGRLVGLREWRTFRRETSGMRKDVALSSPWSGWRAALRQHLAYRKAGKKSDAPSRSQPDHRS